MIINGTHWIIGNGQNILAWIDKWLPKSFHFKPLIPDGAFNLALKVSDLIDHDSCCWSVSV